MSGGRDRGALAIVLHTHMPYVEGFGTWPFGEEWLWEAIAGSYLPLLELLDGGTPLTLSLTPVLCDQLEAPGLTERFSAFVREVRRGTHERDAAGLRAGGHERLARELERSWGDYAGAAERLSRRGSDLLARLLAHAQWTSSATHAVLSGPAVQRIEKSPIEQLVVTNTIPDVIACGSAKIKCLSVAKLLAEAILSIHDETSVSRLFI